MEEDIKINFQLKFHVLNSTAPNVKDKTKIKDL